VDEHIHPESVTRDLALIGLDRVLGYFDEGVLQGRDDVQSTTAISTAAMLEKQAAFAIDVRSTSERNAGHIPGTHHIPLGYLTDHVQDIPRDREIVVHCQSGSRAAIAASVLQAHGFTNVKPVKGGYGEWSSRIQKQRDTVGR
jgi:hydroxyacylglutathione hydrolase